MSKPKKVKRKSNKSTIKTPTQFKVSIDNDFITNYFNSSKIVDVSERNLAINNFFSQHSINSIDINILKQIIEQTSEYSRNYYLSKSRSLSEDERLLVGVEKINIFQTTLEKLLPLCDFSTDELKNTLIQKDFFGLLSMIHRMVERYYDMEFHGEQFFEYHNHIKEKTELHNQYVMLYLDLLLQEIQKDGVAQTNLSQALDILSMYTHLLSFYHYHPLFAEEKNKLQSIVSVFVKNLKQLILKKIEEKEGQKKIVRKRQKALTNEIEFLMENFIKLSNNYEVYIFYIKNMPPVSEDTLLWASFLNKLHSVYKVLKINKEITQPSHLSTLEEYIAYLEKINLGSTLEPLSSKIETINNSLDAFITPSKTSLNHLVKIHNEISHFLEKNTPNKTEKEEDKAYFIHYACKELFTTIKEKILATQSDTLLDIDEYMNLVTIHDTNERDNKLNEFFHNCFGKEIDNAAFYLLIGQIKNRRSSSLKMMERITFDLKTVHIWHISFKKILPFCTKTDQNLIDDLINSYFLALISLLKNMIYAYDKSTKLKSNDYIFYFDNIKEKIQWLITDVEKYQNIKFTQINLGKSLEQTNDAFNDLSDLCFFCLNTLDFLYNHPSFINEADAMCQEMDKFLKHLTHYYEASKNSPSDQKLLDNIALIEDMKNNIINALAQKKEVTKDNKIINDLFTSSISIYKIFKNRSVEKSHKKEMIDLSLINQNIEKLSERNIHFDVREINDILNDVIIAFDSLEIYTQMSVDCHTNEIITKHNSLCKTLLQLINKIEHNSTADKAFIFKIVGVFVKDIFSMLLDDLSAFREKPTVDKIAVSPSPSLADEKDILSIESSFQQFNLNSVNSDSCKNELIESIEETSSQEKEVTLQQFTNYLNEIKEKNELEISSSKAASQLELKKMNEKHELELKKIHQQHQKQMEELNTLLLSIIKKQKSQFKKERKKINKNLQKKFEATKKKYTDDINALKKNQLSTLQEIKERSERLYQTKALEIKQKYAQKKLDLQHAHLISIEKEENRIQEKLISLDKKYEQKFIQKSNELMVCEHALTEKSEDSKLDTEPTALKLMYNNSILSHTPIHRLEIPSVVKLIFSLFKEADIECYIIGGWIRNIFLGLHSIDDDIDFIVNADSNIVQNILNGQGLQSKCQSKLVKLDNIDFWCERWGKNIINALMQKDFSMNTLICNEHGEVFNLLGIDIKQTFDSPYLTILGDDTDVRFKKNRPLVLRSLRLAASLNKRFYDEDWLSLCNNLDSISKLPLGIYLKNIEHMFCSKNALNCFSFIHEAELMRFVFPFLNENDILTQDSALYDFIITKLNNINTTSPIEIISLLMLIPITQNPDYMHYILFGLHNNELPDIDTNKFKEIFCSTAKNIIKNRFQNQSAKLLNKPSILNSTISYCLGQQPNYCGNLQEYIHFYRQYYVSQPVYTISTEYNHLPYHQLTDQYNRHISTRDSTTFDQNRKIPKCKKK